MIRTFPLLLLPAFCLALGLHCKMDPAKDPAVLVSGNIKEGTVVKHLNFPWEILWGPDDFIWMTEREGRISRVNPRTGEVILLAVVNDVVAHGEGGMLGMALHPDFTKTPLVYVGYDYEDDGNYQGKVVQFTYNGRTLINPITLIDHIAASSIHNGCRLLISPDRKLFITTGDASNQELPQDTKVKNGKILRVNLDGSIPSDNPEPGNPYWSFGHRNPQGLVYAHSILYSSEHGPLSDDEVNIIEKGRNYGWPAVRGFCRSNSEKKFCTSHHVAEPMKTWTPTAAVCGLDYYDKDLIPGWKNSLLLVSLKNARLYQLKLDSSYRKIISTSEYLKNKYGRLRDLCISPDGKVYICTSNGGNKDKIIVINN